MFDNSALRPKDGSVFIFKYLVWEKAEIRSWKPFEKSYLFARAADQQWSVISTWLDHNSNGQFLTSLKSKSNLVSICTVGVPVIKRVVDVFNRLRWWWDVRTCHENRFFMMLMTRPAWLFVFTTKVVSPPPQLFHMLQIWFVGSERCNNCTYAKLFDKFWSPLVMAYHKNF